MVEVQAKMFAFEHYAVVPDLICVAKGISGLIGREDVMNVHGPGEMTSTHSGNPICAAAALANLKYMVENHLVEQAARVGEVFQAELSAIHEDFPQVIAAHHGKGLVSGLHVVQPGTETPDGDLTARTVMHAVEKGLMVFAPVGTGGATLKARPPSSSPRTRFEKARRSCVHE